MKTYKVFTRDLSSPIQCGEPVWDGSLPYQLPVVIVDMTDKECGAGWNACRDLSAALYIAGQWPDGHPSRAYVLESVPGIVVHERGDKLRAATWEIISEVGGAEIERAIREWTGTWAGEPAAQMAESQIAWRRAHARPRRSVSEVEDGLTAARVARGLDWALKRYDSARDAWGAWNARAAKEAWGAWDSWDSWNARGALVCEYASLMGWVEQPADLMIRGIREAYASGLGVAVPVAPEVLGWAMDEE